MKGSCFVIYVRMPDGDGGHFPEVLSSVAETEDLARTICEEKRLQGILARWEIAIYWDKDTEKFWASELCDTLQSLTLQK